MSDKTPPPEQPEPTEPTAHLTASDPGHEPGHEPAAHDHTATLPPTHTEGVREKRSGRNPLVPIIAGVVVLVLVAGGLAAFFLTRSDSHKIITPASAGGMKRDKATETQLKTALTEAEKQFKAQDKAIGTTASAIYKQTDKKAGPQGGLVFLGGKLSKPSDTAAATFLSTVRKQAKANGFDVADVDPGAGAKAVCAAKAEGDQKIAICAWATKDTRGELLPTVSGWENGTLSKVMKAVRQDVEVNG